MVSRPTPTPELPGVVHRCALPPSDERVGGRLGTVARTVTRATARRGAGLAVHLGQDGPGAVPAGCWPGVAGPAPVDPIIAANPALVAYAAQLRARREGRTQATPTGLPLTVRRDRGSAGPDALPGALARRSVPTDAPVDPDVTTAVRGRGPSGPGGTR